MEETLTEPVRVLVQWRDVNSKHVNSEKMMALQRYLSRWFAVNSPVCDFENTWAFMIVLEKP